MSSPGRIIVIAGLLIGGVSLGCERAEPPPASAGKAGSTDSTMDSVTAEPTTGWRSEEGPYLVVADDSTDSAMIIPGIEDSISEIKDSLLIDLFNPAGKVGIASLHPIRATGHSDQCLEWQTARVRRTSRSRSAPQWSFGFAASHVLPSAMDSLAGLPRTDSARLVAEIAKLASLAPNDTSLMFRGLPFRVQTAFVLHPSDSEAVLVATVIRNINQEANARTEHLLIIAARDGQRASPFSLRYVERGSGPEESSETAEILGAVLVGAERRPAIVIGRSDDSGTAFSMLERDNRGGWVLRWSSPFSDC